MTAKYIVIDHQKCVRCSLCVKDCTNFVLSLVGDRVVPLNDNCIRCGHCEAICPQNAIKLDLASEGYIDDVEPCLPSESSFTAEQFLKTLKSRRSIRHFREEPIDPTIISKILEAGRFTPTAANRQSVSYIILDREKEHFQKVIMDNFRSIARFFSKFDKWLNLPIDLKKLSRAKDAFLFKNAPIVILIIANNKLDGGLASANIENMANSMGLGVLHVGFFTHLAQYNFRIRRELGLKFRQNIVDCLSIGYPAVKYQRTAQRKAAEITWK